MPGATLPSRPSGAAEAVLRRRCTWFATGAPAPLSVHLSAGQCHDSPQFAPTFEAVTVPTRTKVLVADRGYNSAALRSQLSGRGIEPVIPKRQGGAGARAGLLGALPAPQRHRAPDRSFEGVPSVGFAL